MYSCTSEALFLCRYSTSVISLRLLAILPPNFPHTSRMAHRADPDLFIWASCQLSRWPRSVRWHECTGLAVLIHLPCSDAVPMPRQAGAQELRSDPWSGLGGQLPSWTLSLVGEKNNPPVDILCSSLKVRGSRQTFCVYQESTPLMCVPFGLFTHNQLLPSSRGGGALHRTSSALCFTQSQSLRVLILTLP